MVGLVKVRQLVHDHVLDDGRRQQHGAPVEVEPAALAAGAPAIAEVLHVHNESRCELAAMLRLPNPASSHPA